MVLDVGGLLIDTGLVPRYRVTAHMLPARSCPPLNSRDTLIARRVVQAPCARAAACQLAEPYVAAGLVVDWSARRAGVRRLAQRWRGLFIPDNGEDGTAGVREPRRPRTPVDSAAAAREPPAA